MSSNMGSVADPKSVMDVLT